MDYKIFDSLLEPSFVLNKHQEIIYCNDAAANITGISARKMIRSKLKLTDTFEFETPVTALSELSALGEPSPYQEVRFKTAEGQEGRVQITIQPLPQPDQGQTCYLVFFRDVTLEETLQRKYRKEFEQKETYIRALEEARNQLEDYSKNLEVKVAERTAALGALNQKMKALLDSLNQGFFIFDSNGKILEIASKACVRTLENDPVDQNVWDVLKLDQRKIDGFKKWMTTVFAEMLPFEDLACLAPTRYPHSENREISLEYYPLRNETSAIEGVVVVATDITDLVQAQREAAAEKAHAQMILNLIRNKKQVSGFLREAEQLVSSLKEEIHKPSPSPEITFRILHTLKGGAATFSIAELTEICHQAESYLSEWMQSRSPEHLPKLIQSCSQIGPAYESFLNDNREILGRGALENERVVEIPASSLSYFSQRFLATKFDSATYSVFQHTFLMEPLSELLESNNEVLLNTAEMLGKKVRPLKFKTPGFRILPEPYESLLSTLVHAFRNSIDHGIETPQERTEKGKDPFGTIAIDVLQNKQWLLIRIQDDGCGISASKIREKQIQMGSQVDGLNDQQIIQMVFAPSFSTRDSVTELSGRGVGMDAILSAAKDLGGTAWVRSTPGRGTKLCIRVPWITSDLSHPSSSPSKQQGPASEAA